MGLCPVWTCARRFVLCFVNFVGAGGCSVSRSCVEVIYGFRLELERLVVGVLVCLLWWK